MYNRPYFDHVYNHYDGQRNYPYPQPTSHYMNIDPEQQNFHQTIQQSFQSYYPQTPYDYFTKPQQPMSWL
ncbi:hypothetical protein PD280_02240 [Virgibacillus salarius]|uniref:hypothetical protein n=1 Tax=Virgibacillus salarius TaxID=447199 RepID=UPI0024906F4C|nr:hypothetical protein [Virgibacillus salarius]WBX80672.1 hypothetical protein PD280_02240 [Virgibacillus salarius]